MQQHKSRTTKILDKKRRALGSSEKTISDLGDSLTSVRVAKTIIIEKQRAGRASTVPWQTKWQSRTLASLEAEAQHMAASASIIEKQRNARACCYSALQRNNAKIEGTSNTCLRVKADQQQPTSASAQNSNKPREIERTIRSRKASHTRNPQDTRARRTPTPTKPSDTCTQPTQQ